MIVHMGGPFWANKDDGGWSIPKGEYDITDDPLTAAKREFAEEIGSPPPPGRLTDLGSIKQSSGKVVRVWALEADMDVSVIHSNTFQMQWPRGSGQTKEFAEIDRAGWFDLKTAQIKLVKGQVPFLERLVQQAGELRQC